MHPFGAQAEFRWVCDVYTRGDQEFECNIPGRVIYDTWFDTSRAVFTAEELIAAGVRGGDTVTFRIDARIDPDTLPPNGESTSTSETLVSFLLSY
jgi:hypothetical protein